MFVQEGCRRVASFFLKALSCFISGVSTQCSLLVSLFDHQQHLYIDWMKLRQINETMARCPGPELTLAKSFVF